MSCENTAYDLSTVVEPQYFGDMSKQQLEGVDMPEQQQLEPPQQHQQPLPMRALKARLNSRSSAPTWAAWLPDALQKTRQEGTDASMMNGTYQEAPHMMMAMMPQPSMGEYYEDPLMMMNYEGQEIETYVCPADPDSGEPMMWVPMLVPVAYDNTWQNSEEYMCTSQQEQSVQDYAQSDESSSQDGTVVGSIIGKVWKLSKDANGCRKIQQAFDEACSNEELMALTAELSGHVWEALKCQHANHVLQKCITTIAPQACQFVIDEILTRPQGGAAQAARHRFGCRIVERLLEHCSAEQVAPLVEQLLADTVSLSTHAFGNFVILHLLEHCPGVVSHIASTLKENMASLPADGWVGAVIGEALKHTDNEDARSLAAALLEDQQRVAVMACSRWGHLAVKRALQLADDSSRQQACSAVLRCSDQLRTSRYGRQVSTFAAEQQNSLCICAH